MSDAFCRLFRFPSLQTRIGYSIVVLTNFTLLRDNYFIECKNAVKIKIQKRNTMAEDLKYGPVWITKGAHKGKIMYYDDGMTANRLIVYPCMPLYYNGYDSVK